MAKKRLQSEKSDLEKNEIMNTYFEFGDSNSDRFICHIGEKFVLKFTFPTDYPFKSPEIVFLPPFIPKIRGVHGNGVICINSKCLRNYSPAFRIRDILSKLLEMIRSAGMGYLIWNSKNVNNPIQVDLAFEVANGLLGVMRNIVVLLCKIIGSRRNVEVQDNNRLIGILVGICGEHVVWSHQPFFIRIRHSMNIRIKMTGDLLRAITVKPAITIDDLKKVIEDRYHIPQKALCFFCTDTGSLRELEADRPLYRYGVRDGTALTVRLNAALFQQIGSMLVNVKAFDGKQICLPVNATDTVGRVQTLVEAKWGYKRSEQRFLFAGRQRDDGDVLEDIGVRESSTMHLVLRRPGCDALEYDEDDDWFF